MSNSKGVHNNGCFTDRLGFCNKQNRPLQREIPYQHVLFNKCPRTLGCLDESSSSEPERSVHQSTCRQYTGNLRDQEGFRTKLCSSVISGINQEKITKHESNFRDQSHKGELQCDCRPTFEGHHNFHRMVNSSKNIQQRDKKEISCSGMGSFCNEQELQAPYVCRSLPRRGSGSCGRYDYELEQSQQRVYVPPDSYDFKSPGEAVSRFSKRSCASNQELCGKTLVHEIIEESQESFSVFNKTTAESTSQYCRARLSYYTSRLEALKLAFSHIFPQEESVISFLISTIRNSSANDYQIKYGIFMEFLKSERIKLRELQLYHVLRFLIHLFNKKKAVRTIYAYRSAISQPLKWCFGLDLNSQHITDILKAMTLKRPNNPPREVKWELKDLLSFMDSSPLDSLEEFALQSSAILILLATGWRISELHACVRDISFLSFDVQNILKIRPHDSILAKNECPLKRWEPRIIKPLYLINGNRSKLCPVFNLQTYLDFSSRKSTGPLFLDFKSCEAMSIQKLTRIICNFIRQGCPGVQVRVHDLRKLASSLSLIKCMNISFFANTMNWNSPSTFIKFYFQQTSLPNLEIVTPGHNEC